MGGSGRAVGVRRCMRFRRAAGRRQGQGREQRTVLRGGVVGGKKAYCVRRATRPRDEFYIQIYLNACVSDQSLCRAERLGYGFLFHLLRALLPRSCCPA
jgi:hypothetical protein